MTPLESIKLAEADGPPDVFLKVSIQTDLINAMAHHLSSSLKKKILRELCEQAEAFRDPDAPGHRVWFPHHVQRTALATRTLMPSWSIPPSSEVEAIAKRNGKVVHRVCEKCGFDATKTSEGDNGWFADPGSPSICNDCLAAERRNHANASTTHSTALQ